MEPLLCPETQRPAVPMPSRDENANSYFFIPGSGRNYCFVALEDGSIDAALGLRGVVEATPQPNAFCGSFVFPPRTVIDGKVDMMWPAEEKEQNSTILDFTQPRCKIRNAALCSILGDEFVGRRRVYSSSADMQTSLATVWPDPEACIRIVCFGGTWGVLGSIAAMRKRAKIINIDLVHGGFLSETERFDLEQVAAFENVRITEFCSELAMRHVPMTMAEILSSINHTTQAAVMNDTFLWNYIATLAPGRCKAMKREMIAANLDTVIAMAVRIGRNDIVADAAYAVVSVANLDQAADSATCEAVLKMRKHVGERQFERMSLHAPLTSAAFGFFMSVLHSNPEMLVAGPWVGRYFRPRLGIAERNVKGWTLCYWRVRFKNWLLKMLIN